MRQWAVALISMTLNIPVTNAHGTIPVSETIIELPNIGFSVIPGIQTDRREVEFNAGSAVKSND